MENKGTMLIVDDMELNRTILMQFFREEFQLLEASNGIEALNLLEQYHVDIMLLDLRMPVMDGMEVLAKRQTDPQLAKVPVIVTTSKNDENSEVAAMEKGADDYLTKPYNPTIVRCRVHNVLARLENEWRKNKQAAQEKRISAMRNVMDIDQLTGLYTRNAFLRKARNLIQENTQTTYCIVYLDISNFKVINELCNMETGDLILKTSANYFRTIASKRGIVSHLTGDCFALCIPEDLLDIDLIIQGIDAVMRSMTLYRNIVFYAGIYTVTNTYIMPKQMLDRAHVAMNSAKNKFNRRYAYYDDELRQLLMDEHLMVKEMESSLIHKNFYIELQPIYHPQDCATPVAAEVLLRWDLPQHGLIPPSKFIPVFEKNGFMTRIDRFAWEQACHFLSRQRDWGLHIIPVSINISYINITDSSFVDYLLQLLHKYDLHPWMLWLEISEQAYTAAPSNLLSTLRRLKSCGFTIILDKFGRGFSSLHALQDLHYVDIMKISYQNYEDPKLQERNEIIMDSLIDLAQKLKIKVIIQGIETPEQVHRLQNLQCDCIQGFYYQYPLSSDQYINMLATIDEEKNHKEEQE